MAIGCDFSDGRVSVSEYSCFYSKNSRYTYCFSFVKPFADRCLSSRILHSLVFNSSSYHILFFISLWNSVRSNARLLRRLPQHHHATVCWLTTSVVWATCKLLETIPTNKFALTAEHNQLIADFHCENTFETVDRSINTNVQRTSSYFGKKIYSHGIFFRHWIIQRAGIFSNLENFFSASI